MPRRATPMPTKESALLLTCRGVLCKGEAKATRAPRQGEEKSHAQSRVTMSRRASCCEAGSGSLRTQRECRGRRACLLAKRGRHGKARLTRAPDVGAFCYG